MTAYAWQLFFTIGLHGRVSVSPNNETVALPSCDAATHVSTKFARPMKSATHIDAGRPIGFFGNSKLLIFHPDSWRQRDPILFHHPTPIRQRISGNVAAVNSSNVVNWLDHWTEMTAGRQGDSVEDAKT
jgi:hypothetical protein